MHAEEEAAHSSEESHVTLGLTPAPGFIKREQREGDNDQVTLADM